MSWHGALHELGFALSLLSWTAACLVFRVRLAALGMRGWARACVATALMALVVGGWPDPASLPVRIAIATAVHFAFVAAVATRHKHALPSAPSTTTDAG
jgi:hypothetical protein